MIEVAAPMGVALPAAGPGPSPTQALPGQGPLGPCPMLTMLDGPGVGQLSLTRVGQFWLAVSKRIRIAIAASVSSNGWSAGFNSSGIWSATCRWNPGAAYFLTR